MITYKPLSELPVKEASEIWNRSFEGYMVQASMPLNRFIARASHLGLCMERSLACFVDGHPAGIVMNSFREVDGKKLAWNGGTAVAPEYRGKGIGLSMMERNSELYEELGIQRAYLEAISTNAAAIKLYERVGYTVIDRLLIMSAEGTLADNAQESSDAYTVTRGQAGELRAVPFYRSGDVWQNDLPCIQDGECVLVYAGKEMVGYALFKRAFDPSGKPASITLFRCEAAPGHADVKGVIASALSEVYQPELAVRRSAFNIRASQEALVQSLEQLGLATSMEQVLMVRHYGN